MDQAQLNVDNLRSQAEPFLSEKAKLALDKKSNNTLTLSANGVVTHMALFLGVRVPMSRITKAIEHLASKINELAENDHIHSALSHFLKFDLVFNETNAFNADGSPKEQETVVLCYPMVPFEVHQRMMSTQKKIAMHEGEVPELYED